MKNKKQNSIMIGGLLIVMGLILIFISIFIKSDKIMTSFYYEINSNSVSVSFKGQVSGDNINVEYVEKMASNKENKKYSIKRNDFKDLLKKTNEEDCSKHTYEYQCGGRDGCEFSSFSVSYRNDDKGCYKINNDVISFFNNIVPKEEEDITQSNEITDLLNSNSVFQDNVGVGSSYSGLYYLKDDGTFVFADKDNICTNNHIIYMKGNWEYNNNVLKMSIIEEYKTANGTFIEDPIYACGGYLNNYILEKNTEIYTKNYNIKLSENKEYLEGDLILYKVYLDEEEMNYYFNSSNE